jgi:hypothetical protein
MAFAGLSMKRDNRAGEDMEQMRMNYARAVTDRDLCKQMMERLNTEKESNLQLAYFGAFNAIWAGHVFNPITKLKSFNKGKRYIEMAVKRDQGNVEIRFIRLSVQKNCPSFLGYSENLESDQQFVRTHMGSVGSVQLRKMMTELLGK